MTRWRCRSSTSHECSDGAPRGSPSTPATKSGSSANSPPNTSQSSSGALPGARTPGRNGPASRSPVCATPSPTGHGPCTGEIAIFASTATTDSLLHNESKTSSPRSTETPSASSGDNPNRPPSGPGQARKAITRRGHLPPSQWSQFGLTLPTGQRQPDRLQHAPQQHGAPGIPRGQTGDLLGEGPHPAALAVAEKPAHPQADLHPPPRHRSVDQPALIPAVHPSRLATAPRTTGRHGPRMRPDPHRLTELLESLDHHIGQVRQENPDSIMIITPRTRSQIDDQEACNDTPHGATRSRKVGQIQIH